MKLTGWTVHQIGSCWFVTGYTEQGYQYTKQISLVDFDDFFAITKDGDKLELERRNLV